MSKMKDGRPLPPNMLALLQTSMYVPPPVVGPGELPLSWRPWAPSLAGDVTHHKDRNEWGEIQGRDFHRDQRSPRSTLIFGLIQGKRLEHCRICTRLKEKRDALALAAQPPSVPVRGVWEGLSQHFLSLKWIFACLSFGFPTLQLTFPCPAPLLLQVACDLLLTAMADGFGQLKAVFGLDNFVAGKGV